MKEENWWWCWLRLEFYKYFLKLILNIHSTGASIRNIYNTLSSQVKHFVQLFFLYVKYEILQQK